MKTNRVCHLCGKDYSRDPQWKTSLKRHLARKNPCNRQPAETPYKRTKVVDDESLLNVPIIALDNVAWTPSEVLPIMSRDSIVSWIFMCIFEKPENTCFTKQNLNRNQILVNTSKGTRCVDIDMFIRIFVNSVLVPKILPHVSGIIPWLKNNHIPVDGSTWKGEPRNTDFMVKMRCIVNEFIGLQKNRTGILKALRKEPAVVFEKCVS